MERYKNIKDYWNLMVDLNLIYRSLSSFSNTAIPIGKFVVGRYIYNSYTKERVENIEEIISLPQYLEFHNIPFYKSELEEIIKIYSDIKKVFKEKKEVALNWQLDLKNVKYEDFLIELSKKLLERVDNEFIDKYKKIPPFRITHFTINLEEYVGKGFEPFIITVIKEIENGEEISNYSLNFDNYTNNIRIVYLISTKEKRDALFFFLLFENDFKNIITKFRKHISKKYNYDDFKSRIEKINLRIRMKQDLMK